MARTGQIAHMSMNRPVHRVTAPRGAYGYRGHSGMDTMPLAKRRTAGSSYLSRARQAFKKNKKANLSERDSIVKTFKMQAGRMQATYDRADPLAGVTSADRVAMAAKFRSAKDYLLDKLDDEDYVDHLLDVKAPGFVRKEIENVMMYDPREFTPGAEFTSTWKLADRTFDYYGEVSAVDDEKVTVCISEWPTCCTTQGNGGLLVKLCRECKPYAQDFSSAPVPKGVYKEMNSYDWKLPGDFVGSVITTTAEDGAGPAADDESM